MSRLADAYNAAQRRRRAAIGAPAHAPTIAEAGKAVDDSMESLTEDIQRRVFLDTGVDAAELGDWTQVMAQVAIERLNRGESVLDVVLDAAHLGLLMGRLLEDAGE